LSSGKHGTIYRRVISTSGIDEWYRRVISTSDINVERRIDK